MSEYHVNPGCRSSRSLWLRWFLVVTLIFTPFLKLANATDLAACDMHVQAQTEHCHDAQPVAKAPCCCDHEDETAPCTHGCAVSHAAPVLPALIIPPLSMLKSGPDVGATVGFSSTDPTPLEYPPTA